MTRCFSLGGKTFGELTAQEKDRVSHRGNALRKLAQELPAYLKQERIIYDK